MKNNIIHLENVSKSFILPHLKRTTLKEHFLSFWRKTKPDYLKVLDHISLTIPRGEFLGVMGKNGSGKSTLLRLLSNIYTPETGTIKIEGKVAPFLELGIGFQPELSARENVFINGALLGLTPKMIQNKFDHIIDFAEIRPFLDLKIKNFSSGMRSRLAFAIATQADADIYLCDEVLAVGDLAFQQKCLKIFQQWKQAQKTIIFVSHNPSLIEDFCDRALILADGKVKSIGAPSLITKLYSQTDQST